MSIILRSQQSCLYIGQRFSSLHFLSLSCLMILYLILCLIQLIRMEDLENLQSIEIILNVTTSIDSFVSELNLLFTCMFD